MEPLGYCYRDFILVNFNEALYRIICRQRRQRRLRRHRPRHRCTRNRRYGHCHHRLCSLNRNRSHGRCYRHRRHSRNLNQSRCRNRRRHHNRSRS